VNRKAWLSWLGWIAGWAWTFLAGWGGLWLLVTRGPWPPTNGWFALASGLSACPLIGWVFARIGGVRVSGWIQFGAAALFYGAGRVALLVWPHGG
jgi:hypothetical protein